MELETHFIIANELGYLSASDLATALSMTDELGRMLTALKKSLKERKSDHASDFLPKTPNGPLVP